MYLVCSLDIKVVTSILPFLRSFPFGPSLTTARNQIQMAPARLNCCLLHRVHPYFSQARCVGTNCSDAQEPFEFESFSRRESNRVIQKYRGNKL